MKQNKIKKIRTERGLSVRELSEKTGIAYSYLNELENGNKNNPTKATMDKLAEALVTTVCELFY